MNGEESMPVIPSSQEYVFFPGFCSGTKLDYMLFVSESQWMLDNECKISKWKLNPLKYLLIILVLGAFGTLISSPSCRKNGTPNAVSRWIWGGGSDPRYTSEFNINWQEISTALHLPLHNNNMTNVGFLNFNASEIHHLKQIIPNATHHIVLHLEPADKNMAWDLLFPEWIDEEEDEEVPICPSLPTLQVPRQRLDLIAVKLPCRKEGNWNRDIARLHLQIAVAKLAASHKGNHHPLHLLFVTSCFPMPNLFPCKELVVREGKAWLYTTDLTAMRERSNLPLGACELALPMGGIDQTSSLKPQREAYATILHSVYSYVCGAIVAGQSIRMSGSTRDLIILVDESISAHHRRGLESAGWQVRTIQRIRNPKAEKDSYNEWNYSKFRLWQLTDYDKIIFIDSDMLILNNIDALFRLPEISATGNSGPLFNSGVMVIEPSNCTFNLLMDHIDAVDSYNGGDQGFLNEIYTWWHRIPRHMNFLKHFWIGDDEEMKEKKLKLFAADPPVLYVLHFLGNKPWVCFKDYDCNWNVDRLREFASDAAHARWWNMHDRMPEELQSYCLLRTIQKAELEWERMEAEKGNYSDGHWRRRIGDERLRRCIDRDCSWRGMLRHWNVSRMGG